jgi:hypothetical protein
VIVAAGRVAVDGGEVGGLGSRRGWRRAVAWRIAAAGALGLFAVAPVRATDYSITSFSDGLAVDGECRLREAIRAAATNLAVNECPAGGADDAIVLQSVGSYLFTSGDENLTAGALTIRGATPVAADYVIDLQHVSRFLEVLSGARIALAGLTVTHGDAMSTTPPEGGALRVVDAHLALTDVVLSSSTASVGGGLAWTGEDFDARLERVALLDDSAIGQASLPSPRGGGAVFRAWGGARLTLDAVVLSGNRAATAESGSSAYAGGAEIDANGPPGAPQVDLFRLTVIDNEVESLAAGDGGGLLITVGGNGRVRLEDAELADNRLLFSANVLAGDEMSASTYHDSTLDLRRARARDGVASGLSSSQIVLVGQHASQIRVDGVLATGADQNGIDLHGMGSATVVAGQLTVSESGNIGLVANATLGAATVRIENSILWGNGPDSGASDLRLFGAIDADRVANRLWVGDQGDPDPLFVAPPAGDFQLQAVSPALDAGETAFLSVGPYDLRHAPRVAGLALDLGAYERGGLFGDGFETGGTAAWSAAAP